MRRFYFPLSLNGKRWQKQQQQCLRFIQIIKLKWKETENDGKNKEEEKNYSRILFIQFKTEA